MRKKREDEQIEITDGQDANGAAGVKFFEADKTVIRLFLNQQMCDKKTADDEEKTDAPVTHCFTVVHQQPMPARRKTGRGGGVTQQHQRDADRPPAIQRWQLGGGRFLLVTRSAS